MWFCAFTIIELQNLVEIKPSDSGGNVVNLKSLMTDGQTEGLTDDRQNSDQKSSLELDLKM